MTGSGGSPANAADFAGGVLPIGHGQLRRRRDQQDHHRQRRRRHRGGGRRELHRHAVEPTGGARSPPRAATGTILNDDPAPRALDRGGAASARRRATAAARRSPSPSRARADHGHEQRAWAVTGSGGAGERGRLHRRHAALGHGQLRRRPTSQTITVNVAGDTIVEPNEGFTVTLSDAGAGQSAPPPPRRDPQRRLQVLRPTSRQSLTDVTASTIDGNGTPNDNIANAILRALLRRMGCGLSAVPDPIRYRPLALGRSSPAAPGWTHSLGTVATATSSAIRRRARRRYHHQLRRQRRD